MKNATVIRRSALALALASGLGSASAGAHGPTIVLTNVNGQIVTNQLDVTPQNDSTIASDYPVGAPARVFPSQYNVANYNSFTASANAANQPSLAAMQAIPMTWVSVSGDTTGNAGYYGQLEVTDAIGNNTLNTGPGYAYGNGGFAAGTIFQITYGSTLKYWNGSSFGVTPDGEQLQAIRGSSITPGTGFANTLTSNGVSGGTGLQVSVSTSQNGGSHSQLMYRLEDSLGNSVESGETQPSTSQIADGLYLATFDIGTATTSADQLISSQPYYFLFDLNRNNDVTQAQVNAAVANLNSSVPEPTSLGLLAIAGVALLGRRRRCVA
jgi:hypothetical protein